MHTQFRLRPPARFGSQLLLSLCLLFSFFSFFSFFPSSSLAEETRLDPLWPVPDYVEHLLEVASAEVGYREDRGRTKYGEWAGDPYCQWCAEFQCWCVDQVDRRWGTSLLKNVYPLYTSSNTGRAWFIEAGRYVIRKGPVEGWGYEWLKGQTSFLRSGDYVPQPGDWVFFTWTANTDTDHVALVEYCTRDDSGRVLIHVIEGNNPVAVARNEYELNDGHILGYGAVHDAVDITMQFGNTGEKVRQLQEKLIYLGYLDAGHLSGHFGNATLDALRAFQTSEGQRASGIANIQTQLRLDEAVDAKYNSDPATWTVVDEE